MKPNLNKMLCHGGQDIEDLKIYHDTKTEQYKVRHYCDRCGLDLGCFCYETIEDAIYACSEVMTMTKPKSIQFGDGDSGIQIRYIKSRDTLEFFGWYDHYVGIEPHEITFGEFKKQLGITK